MAELLAFCQRYHLERHPSIRTRLDIIHTHHASSVARALVELRDLVRPFREFHREHPHVVVRDGLDGPIILGTQTADRRRIGLTTDDINLHGTIVGPSGSGKTTILLSIAAYLLALSILLHVIDVKEDFGWLLRRPDVLLVDEETRWNPLLPPSFLTPHEARNEVVDLLLARFYGAEHQRQLLHEAWDDAARRRPIFAIADIVESLRTLAAPREPASRAEARRGCIARLRRFEDHALFTTRDDGIPWDVLLNRTYVVRSRALDDVARLEYDLLARYAFLQDRYTKEHGLRRVLLIDESYALLTTQQDGIRAIEPLVSLKQLCREFGMGIINTTVTLDGLSTLARTSTHFHIVLPPNNQEEAAAVIRVLGLEPDAAEHFLHRMQLGDALLRIGSCPDVVHLHVSPTNERKHATHDEIRMARARTNRLAQTPRVVHLLPPSSLATAAAREGIASTGQPTPSQESAPSSSPPSRLAPVVEEIPSNRRVPLTKHAAAILEDVADHPLTLTTPCFQRCGLRLSEGDRAKTLLVNLGLLESHRVRTGAGRGKTGSALRVTQPAGWQWLARMPPKGTRGGDAVQHEFLVIQLSSLIPRSTIETLGADLVIPYNSEDHTQLHRALETLRATTIALNMGDLIALEVECSRPEITGPRNVARDTGFALTIIAALGEAVQLQRTIGETDRVLIVDVLRLLDALRTTERR
jgi:hypothetical protein